MARVRVGGRDGGYIGTVGGMDDEMASGTRGRHPRWRAWPHSRGFPRWSGGRLKEEERGGGGRKRKGGGGTDMRGPPVIDTCVLNGLVARPGQAVDGLAAFRGVRCS
jgi:hypothetical protein